MDREVGSGSMKALTRYGPLSQGSGYFPAGIRFGYVSVYKTKYNNILIRPAEFCLVFLYMGEAIRCLYVALSHVQLATHFGYG